MDHEGRAGRVCSLCRPVRLSFAQIWTMKAERGRFVAQHEHTLIVTKGKPFVLTATNGMPWF